MLSAAEFAKFIGVSREAVRGSTKGAGVLGLHGAKRVSPMRFKIQEIYKGYESTLRSVIQSVFHDEGETDPYLLTIVGYRSEA